jgi:hypothetical protein
MLQRPATATVAVAAAVVVAGIATDIESFREGRHVADPLFVRGRRHAIPPTNFTCADLHQISYHPIGLMFL